MARVEMNPNFPADLGEAARRLVQDIIAHVADRSAGRTVAEVADDLHGALLAADLRNINLEQVQNYAREIVSRSSGTS